MHIRIYTLYALFKAQLQPVCMKHTTQESAIPYTAKLSRGKTFAVVHKTHHSLENFRGASGPCHYVLYTANDSRGKLSRLATKPRKPRKFSPSKVLPYTVIISHDTLIKSCTYVYIRVCVYIIYTYIHTQT